MAILALALLGACKREVRELRPDPPVAAALGGVAALPVGIGGRPPEVYFALGKPYRTNAYQLSEGKRLYAWFGCAECHGQGEGTARGPALLDGWWNYGPAMETIYLSLRDGRPGGMPAFHTRLTEDQLWQLAGYVQQLGAYSGGAAAPGRSDEPPVRPAENRAPARFAPLEP
ncbi:c-type cytochrome [Siccirubricoccus phaeus]|uniref:c-type cytochrome n=1 Tax=Siccirubricoccus phaeus TaxID=2595053 RepID=UPI0011F2E04C|nr:c-type cytochrome [Siccirubricoccus phaeus]